ncbi:MAG: DNA-directed RNA polymerase subunit H [Candidatus Aenigmarchaeota archaeon ex4484_56]|nr:MAG: DNA-directed RNA polymerase subunit H [Candidatus Aenigmarchaeota archaeon ex4484_56]
MTKKEIIVGNHIIVPKHTVLTEKEKNDFLKKYNEKELPKIKIDDPAIKRLNVAKGDIVKIERKIFDSDETYFYYRLVV